MSEPDRDFAERGAAQIQLAACRRLYESGTTDPRTLRDLVAALLLTCEAQEVRIRRLEITPRRAGIDARAFLGLGEDV